MPMAAWMMEPQHLPQWPKAIPLPAPCCLKGPCWGEVSYRWQLTTRAPQVAGEGGCKHQREDLSVFQAVAAPFTNDYSVCSTQGQRMAHSPVWEKHKTSHFQLMPSPGGTK